MTNNILYLQYDHVKSSRGVLLDYCATFSPADFVKENSSFGRGSMRNLLVHIANTYEFWIGKWGLQKEMIFTKYDSISNIEEAKVLFSRVDELVEDFLKKMQDTGFTEVEFEISRIKQKTQPLKLFTHVITHEFHHKGQILSFSRHLGYTPVDTDIMR